MAGYVRQSSAEIIPGATVRAAPLNVEYNTIQDAFAATTGHKHDGNTGEGGYVPLIADTDRKNSVEIDTANNRVGFFIEVSTTKTEQLRLEDGVLYPVVNNDIDLGTSALQFKNLWIDGTANIDAMVGDTLALTSNASVGGTLGVTGATTLSSTLDVTGNTDVGGTLDVTGATALSSTLSVGSNTTVSGTLTSVGNFYTQGNTYLGNSATDKTHITGFVATNLIPDADNTRDFGSDTYSWNDIFAKGTTKTANLTVTTGATFSGATIADLGSVTTADINGGTIDAVAIGNSTVATLVAVDQLRLDGRTISSVDTNGDINITPNGTGEVNISKVDIDSGAIDGTAIGSTTPSTGSFTTLSASGGVTANVSGDVTGNVTATSGTSTFYDVKITNGLNMDASSAATITNLSAPTGDLDAATKKYVDDSIAGLIDGAPTALDTLNEIAAAINDDATLYTTLTDSIATKLPKAGGTMSGSINMGGFTITNSGAPVNANDLATKGYIDTTYVDYSSAGDAATDARKLAINAEDVQYTLADGTTTGYSALHYAAKAAQSFDSFDDRYLGAKGSDPALDNDGNALLTGALYFDSTNNVTKVFNGTEWQAASSSIEGIKSDFEYVATASQTVFSGADANGNVLVIDKAELVNVYYNGVRLKEGSDYNISAATDTVTIIGGAATGDLIDIEVFGNFAGQTGAEVSITGGVVANVTLNNANVASGDLTFADNQKAIFGAGSDLQIYHTGSRSYIAENGTGNLRITGTDIRLTNSAESATYAYYVDGGKAELYHNNSPKLATTSAGIDVTGTTSTDTVTLPNGWVVSESGGNLYFAKSGTNMMKLDASGNLDVLGNVNSNATIS